MRRLGGLVLVIAALVVTVLVVLSCGRQVPTQPIQSNALHLTARLWHEGDTYAYAVEGRPDETAIRVIRIAMTDAVGNRQFLTYSRALATLNDDAIVRVASVWRIVPSHVGRSPRALGNITIADEEWPMRMELPGTDPELPGGGGACPCGEDCYCCTGGDVSMRCVKCCWSI